MTQDTQIEAMSSSELAVKIISPSGQTEGVNENSKSSVALIPNTDETGENLPGNQQTGELLNTANGKTESMACDVEKSDKASTVQSIPKQMAPPDGGWGWVIVFAAMSVTTVVGGSYIGFAILYIEFVDAFNSTRAAAGWIASIAIGCGNMMGIFFGGSVRRYGSRIVCMIGAVVTSLGYLLSSLSTSIVHLYLTCGIVAGVGVSMMVVSSLVIVQQYFNKHRALAASVAVFGFSLGTLIAGPVIQLLLDYYTWRGTLIIIGGIFLQVIVFASLYRPLSPAHSPASNQPQDNTEPKDPHQELNKTTLSSCLGFFRKVWHRIGAIFGCHLLLDPQFLLYVLSAFFTQVMITVFLQHTPSRAAYLGIERHKIALLPTIIGSATGISCLAFGFVANNPNVNRLLQYSIAVILTSIVHIMTISATTFPTIALISVLESFCNGIFFCIQTTVVVDIKGIENVAQCQALLCFSLGLSTLFSTPFAGYLFDVTQEYNIPFLVSGCLGVFGGLLGLLIVWLRCLRKPDVQN